MREKNNNWKIHKDKNDTQKIASDLKMALKKDDYLTVLSLLSSPINLKSFVVRRGEKGEYYDLILDSFLFLLKKDLSFQQIQEIKSKVLIDFVHKKELPEIILSEILAIAFHKRDEKLFKYILDVILKNKKLFKNIEVTAFALNIWGAWLGVVEKNHEKNIEVNKQALAIARDHNLGVLECKALFALCDHKGHRKEKILKPRNQVDDYENLSKKFMDLGIDYDSFRCDIELALSYLNLSKKQVGKDREKNLEKALLEAKKAQKNARKMVYPNALIRIKNILSDIYEQNGNEIQSSRYAKEAAKLREKYF